MIFKYFRRNNNAALLLIVLATILAGLGLNIDLQFDEAGNENAEYVSKGASVSSYETESENVFVKRVIDGDTVELDSGLRLRYIGIDTPEMNPVECYSRQATEKNRELVEGKEVRLEKDVSETDRYGRLLRYVWVGESLINEILVREGYAASSTYPPDVKYQERFRAAERLAREERLGLWGDECME